MSAAQAYQYLLGALAQGLKTRLFNALSRTWASAR